MKLYVDAHDNLKTVIKVGQHEYTKEYQSPRDQDIFSAVQTALKQAELSPNQLSEIEVYPGPGSYTGLRLAFAIAQAIGYVNQIPVNGLKFPDQALPKYED